MTTTGKFGEWHRIGNAGQLKNGERMHVRIEGRYITVFKHGGKLSALDSICYHAGGPLTLGPLKDIEDLNATFVACPWHRYLVNIDGGQRAYQAINFDNKTGKPVVQGWTMGKVVQRPHLVEERNGEIYLVSC